MPADDEAVAVFKAVARTTKARKVALVGMLNQKTCDEAMARALQARGYGKDGGDRPVPSWFAEGELRTSVGTGRGPSGVRLTVFISGSRPRKRARPSSPAGAVDADDDPCTKCGGFAPPHKIILCDGPRACAHNATVPRRPKDPPSGNGPPLIEPSSWSKAPFCNGAPFL